MTQTQRMLELLGGKKILGANPKSELELIPLVRAGIPYKALEIASASLEVSLDEIASALGLARRTLSRRKSGKRKLTSEESERVLRLIRVSARAEEVFGDRQAAREWVRAPSRALGMQPPQALLDTDIGTEAVLDELGRIEHGVYS